MRVLVVGAGGREHAIVWLLRQSPSVRNIFCAPGNAGIAEHAELVPIQQSDITVLLRFATRNDVDLTIVGPEQPLTLGIVDLFEEHGLKIFGPKKTAAMLEGSKVFAKEFMQANRIPTARYRKFSAGNIHESRAFVETMEPPMVVKADGLAAGKGVVIAKTREEALDAVEAMMHEKVFGEAGERVVIEEFLKGEEVSVFVLTDGSRYAMLAPAQDHKRIFDGDMGKNTGGMGAYAPAPIATAEVMSRVAKEIVEPTLEGMRRLGTPYRGCLYCGLMVTDDGPRVLEYNCRLGDPEAQVVIPLIEGDIAAIMLSVAEGTLNPSSVRLRPATAVCVVMASNGYPDHYDVGKEILGLDSAKLDKRVVVFHAGTKREGNNVLTAGGRVLGVTAIGPGDELEDTIQAAYHAVERISFDGAYFRSDIGKKGLRVSRSPRIVEGG